MMKTVLNSLLLLAVSLPHNLLAHGGKDGREYYRITIYHFKTPEQKLEIDQYLEKAYLPALHRQGIKNIGVFTPIANDTIADKRLFVIMPAESLQVITDINEKLDKDASYQEAAKSYLGSVYNNAPYVRMENILTYAFTHAPSLTPPKLTSPKADHVYEYRSYESPTEKIFRNKVHMFNEGGEVSLFKRLNFNAVFYSEVMAGSNMPNLIYMTSFENMADRDGHWNTFRDDAEWKKLSSDTFYKNNVSKVEVTLMKAASYSDY